MKLITITQLIIFFLFCLSIKAQPLQEGQQFPNITFKQLFNTNSKEINLSSFKGKLIVFDFWGIHCITCIQAFPKLDSLQKKFGNQIQIIPVSTESKQTIAAFFAKRTKIKIPDLPFICSDTILQKLFPHEGLPAYVWLDDNHQYRFITAGFSVNEKSIAALINKEEVKLPTYKTGHTKIKNIINKEYEEKMEYLSYLSRCTIGYQEGYNDSLRNRSTGIHISCASATELYLAAYNEGNKYNFNRVGRLHTDFKNPVNYIRPPQNSEYGQWRENHSFNYELLLPLSMSDNKYEKMKADLQLYFQLKAGTRPVKVKCLVLERISAEDKLKTKGGKPFNTFFRSSAYGTRTEKERCLINFPFEHFASSIGSWLEREKQLPFEDHAGYTGNIDITLSEEAIETLSLTLLNKELSSYGLRIIEKEIMIVCLFLSDK